MTAFIRDLRVGSAPRVVGRLPAIRCAAFLAFLTVACGGAPGSKGAVEDDKISPPPRSVVVEDDRVVIEGCWHSSAAQPSEPLVPNAVRVVCVRGERTCKEDLTRPSTYPGAAPVHDLWQYRVDEWTKAGQVAGKLVASRREGAATVEIRVSLSGLAAEKVVKGKGEASRFRLE